MAEFKGVTTFHSETGTEGGYWAMQDEQFMGLPNPAKVCKRCGTWWEDPDKDPEPGVTFFYLVDDAGDEERKITKGFPEMHPELDADNDRYNRMHNSTVQLCHTRGHAGWRKAFPDGAWSYDGLHVLATGDHLTVYERDGETVKWEGKIDLTQHELFTEAASNMWIHADQKGMDRDEWAAMFLNEHPCKLVTREETDESKSE